MKKFLMSLLIIGVLAAAGAGVVVGVWATALATPPERIEKPDTTPAVSIQVVEPKRVEDRMYLTGLVEPWEAVTISAEIAGKIEWQGPEEGDAIEVNVELIRIDTTTAQARLDQARAEHTLTSQEFERVRELRERGISSPQEFDRAATNRDAAAAVMRLAEVDLAHSVIRSGISGVVDRLYNETGEYVTPGKPLVRVVQVDKLKVLVGIPERDVSHFKQSDTVALRFDAMPDDTFEARIYRIATTAEPATRTFVTELELTNPYGAIKPGMIARVALVRESHANAITVPMFAVMSRAEGRFVFVEENGIAVLRPIEVGFFQGGDVLVTAGLAPGDRVIVTGQRTLSAGEPVKITASVGAS